MLSRKVSGSSFPSFYFLPAPKSRFREPSDEQKGLIFGPPHRPASVSDIVEMLLAAGYTMAQIQEMFPGFFMGDPAP